jgi:hypothetical protein
MPSGWCGLSATLRRSDVGGVKHDPAQRVRRHAHRYLRMACEKCGRERYLAETHLTLDGIGDVRVGGLIGRVRHSGCGGQSKSSSRPKGRSS